MFLVSSNFNRLPYSIPNINQNLGFDNYADQEERAMLKKLLGIAFYTEFNNAFNALPEDYSSSITYALNTQVVSGNNIYKSLQAANTGHPVNDGAWWELVEEDNKYLLLINGAVYEYNGTQYEWVGMAELFKPYVYSKWVEHTREEVSGTGVVVSVNENAEAVSPVNQICDSWNDFARKAGTSFSVVNSLYGYLISVEDNFDTGIIFKDPGRKNFAGI